MTMLNDIRKRHSPPWSAEKLADARQYAESDVQNLLGEIDRLNRVLTSIREELGIDSFNSWTAAIRRLAEAAERRGAEAREKTIVAWLRGHDRVFASDLANAIESGAHLKEADHG